MKYRVLLDRGVDVAGQHYAHDAVIDDEKATPAMPASMSEDNRQSYDDGMAKKTAEDIKSLANDGAIVEDAPDKTRGHGKGKE